MSYTSKNRSEFYWIGESTVFIKASKKYYHYRSFSLNGVIYEVGDSVLIRNEDSVDPEDSLNCFVAQITDLHHSDYEPELYYAKIKWFSRMSDLPKYCQSALDPNELVEDNRRSWSDVIDLETIFNKCLIMFLSEFEELPKPDFENEFPVFFCRYRLLRNKLKPLNRTDNETPSSTPTLVKKGLNSSKAKNQYCVMQTGSLKFPKILIKKMDDRVLESKNENVRILVAKPDVRTIDDVTGNLNELSLLSPSGTPTRKRPYIHSLKVTPRTRSRDVPGQRSSPGAMDCDSSESQEEQHVRTKNITPAKKANETSTPQRASARLQCISIKDEKSSPSKKGKTPRCLEFSTDSNNHSITRSGRKVKSVLYSEKCSSDEECKAVISSKKKLLKNFIRATYSDDSGSENAYSNASTSEDSDCSLSDQELKPSVTKKGRKTFKSSKETNMKRLSSIPGRKTPLKGPQNVLEESRMRLHVSMVPKSLPCREEEYSDIYSFVKGCLCSETGGCMYISGLPGTGKTATVHEVIRNLEAERGDIPIFSFVEVNGMRMTDPYQCYVQIFKSLTGKTIAPQQAANLLEKRFTERGPKKDAVVLLVDELDRLWTRKQTVMYNIFDWPSKKHSKLIVLAIANTMDLPERLMMNRISSRLGLTRKTFSPYNFKQLQEIIMSRIQELQLFDSDAVQLAARKVAAVSGDARRALDICRHAIEVAERVTLSPKKKRKILVGMEHIDVAIQQMFSSPVISTIRSCSKMEKMFFQGLLAEFNRTGSEETTLLKVSQHLASSCRLEGFVPPTSSAVSALCARLARSHLLLLDNFQNGLHMKIRLKPSPEDVKFALTEKMFQL